jgi:hypothetical protein
MFAVRADAGWKDEWDISIVKYGVASGYAEGSFGTVRANANDNAFIACYVTSTGAYTSNATCYAGDGTQWAYCYTSAANLVSTVNSLSDNAALFFTWNDSGECTTLQVFKGSEWRPASP